MIALLLLGPALAFDHTHADFEAVLTGAVVRAGVHYDRLATRGEVLDRYLKAVASADASAFSEAEKIAFYINAYNAYTLRTVLDARPLGSVKELDGGKLWDTRRFQVAGESLTLNQIENERVRNRADARAHAVLNCAAKGCPPLSPSPLRPDTLSTQLDAAVRVWAETNAYRVDGESIFLSHVFDWYGPDFSKGPVEDLPGVEGKKEAALVFLLPYVGRADATRFRQGGAKVDWEPYDWALNGVE